MRCYTREGFCFTTKLRLAWQIFPHKRSSLFYRSVSDEGKNGRYTWHQWQVRRLPIGRGLLPCRKSGKGPFIQGILKGEVSLYCWPPVSLVWIGLFANKNKNCQLSSSWFQASQTGGQWYSDTYPFGVPWFISISPLFENPKIDRKVGWFYQGYIG
jgi:hypothetical protein